MCMATSKPNLAAGTELIVDYGHAKYDPFTFFARYGTAFWPEEHRKRRDGPLCKGTEQKTDFGETNIWTVRESYPIADRWAKFAMVHCSMELDYEKQAMDIEKEIER